MSFISRDELKLIVAFGILGAVWMLYIVPYLANSLEYQSLNPLLQYIIYNAGEFLIVSAALGFPLSKVAEDGEQLTKFLRASFAAWLIVELAVDMLMPPFYLDSGGHVIITNANALTGASVDSVFAYVWSSVFPQVVNTPMLYALVYIITPILGLIAAAAILKPRAFRALLAHRAL